MPPRLASLLFAISAVCLADPLSKARENSRQFETAVAASQRVLKA